MIPFLLVEATVCSVFFHECEAEGVETKAIVESTCTSAVKWSTTFNITMEWVQLWCSTYDTIGFYYCCI